LEIDDGNEWLYDPFDEPPQEAHFENRLATSGSRRLTEGDTLPPNEWTSQVAAEGRPVEPTVGQPFRQGAITYATGCRQVVPSGDARNRIMEYGEVVVEEKRVRTIGSDDEEEDEVRR
jgi:hypothetical protein